MGQVTSPPPSKRRVHGVRTGLVTLELVLFPFVFQARLHNRQSVTVLTSWKVSSTGIQTRNHTNSTSWEQDSSKIKLNVGLNCGLAPETWKHTIQRMNLRTWQSGIKYRMWEIQRNVYRSSRVDNIILGEKKSWSSP